MSQDTVNPLRISKSSTTTTAAAMSAGAPRPLSELSPSEMRRNSPSWHQGSPAKKTHLKTDSSPFQSSPLENLASPRLFWQNRNTENSLYGRSGSPSPTRRSSIERLQKASRVKNSNILALEQKQEYDPTRIPQIERPLAKVQGNAFSASNSSGLRSPDTARDNRDYFSTSARPGPLNMSLSKNSVLDTSELPSTPRTPSKDQSSPFKSSLSPSKFKSSFDPETGIWTGDSSFEERELPSGRSLHRHAKSVTFDAAPPQINEYEMATPDLSSIGSNSREGSYDSIDDEDDEGRDLYDPAHVGMHEDSFDASLEDTDKTPVVGPDDWRGDSPQVRHGTQGQWESSPMPESSPAAASAGRMPVRRQDSTNSNGEHRPLPPLPGASHNRSNSTGSATASPALSATAERMLGYSRGLPSPPPAATSKADIQNIGNGKMKLEERLKLMMLSDDNGGKTAAELQRERRLRRGNGRERIGSPAASEPESVLDDVFDDHEADDTIGDISALGDYELPQRISRESIMRRVNGNNALARESDYNFSSPAPSSSPQRSPQRSPERQLTLDPEVPIPSIEDSVLYEEDENDGSVIITRNPEDEGDDVLDLYQHSDVDHDDPNDKDIRDDDSESHYSDSIRSQQQKDLSLPDEASTPRAGTPTNFSAAKDTFPTLGPNTRHSAFSQDFQSFMLPEAKDKEPETEPEKPVLPQKDDKPEPEAPRMSDAQAYLSRPYTPEQVLSKPEYDGSGWGEPEESMDDEPGTPESVIHHRISDEYEDEEFVEAESPAVPEKEATIKASGSKLKTRASNTPADLAAMREARRHVSYEVPSVPAIPQKHRNRLSRDMSNEKDAVLASQDDFLERHPSFKDRSLTLDLAPGLNLERDFERVVEAQKRGYLMRQNTKLVAASDNDGDNSWKARSAGNSPVKANRPQSWTVEPWNGKVRSNSNRSRPSTTGPVPPLPGQQSNAAALKEVPEEDIQSQFAPPESGERGRLFVKVMGVKDLDLPIPKNERSWFSLTLDNGVHCVTTAWLELARNAPIGQEFELVVPNDLEFQLTLNVKLEKPAPIKLAPTGKASKSKGSAFSRVFTSPKKRKEMELRQREEDQRAAQQKREADLRSRNAAPTAYELFAPLAAEDGSVARSYVCLKEHENRCFGRPYMAEVACFNEWATEEAGFASSVKSKRGSTAVIRKAPYKIGKLELQLLFVPRPKNSADEDMPKSMNTCIRELKAAEERMSRNWEGHLSQQGGDCPYWRRRYFKLVGTKLTAYHEATRQPRATINLANAKRLIDDRRALTEMETLGKGGKRRRSAFAEEEEGYMFVEEGFRIRFNNGEVIDFYADTAEDKESWMKVLSDVIGRGDSQEEDSNNNGIRSRAKWCELVLKREEQLRRRASGRRVHSRTKSMHA